MFFPAFEKNWLIIPNQNVVRLISKRKFDVHILCKYKIIYWLSYILLSYFFLTATVLCSKILGESDFTIVKIISMNFVKSFVKNTVEQVYSQRNILRKQLQSLTKIL